MKQKHKILLRQLQRSQLSEDACPTDLAQWRRFLDRINLAYEDLDQDRYLSDRTQEISDQEMQELNQELQEAQSIAHLGSWTLDWETKQVQLSPEACRIFNINISQTTQDYYKMMNFVHPDDRQHLEELIQAAINQQKNYETELRIVVKNKNRWIDAIGKPRINAIAGKVKKLTGTILDITDRKLSDLRQSMEHSITRYLLESENIISAMPQILQIICQTFNWQLGVLWHWDDNQKMFIRDEIWGQNSSFTKQYLTIFSSSIDVLNSGSILDQVRRELSPLWLDISQQKANYREFAQAAGIQSIFAFPVLIENKPALILKFFCISKEPPNEADLQNINAIGNQIGILIERKNAQEREKRLNKELVIAAKQAGMAEIATSVLHNVGNVLNSVNVGTLFVMEKIRDTKLSNLQKMAQLYLENQNNLVAFITQDPKGKHFLNYLVKLADYWDQEQALLLKELESLRHNIEHIKTIIIRQQSLSGTSGLVELNLPVDILEEALQIYMDGLKNANIAVIREYNSHEEIMVDKSKLHQIFVNLIGNAKEALLNVDLDEKKIIDKKITLRVFNKDSTVIIQVIDNGIGIRPDNITQIFSFGFTTMKSGHGFGLYFCALAAKEMNGKLTAQSDGPNKGATFTLELPKYTDTNRK